jgi:hypothetical protein
MPRCWSEYTAREWRRLRPVVERYKHARYQLRLAYHVRRQVPDFHKLDELAARIRGRNLLATIAFNDVELIEHQVSLVRKHVTGCVHLIADNSSSEQAASAIRQVATDGGACYLRTPRGPWHSVGHGGRSHGLAMTWLWRNVIRQTQPIAFGFLDHDIFPLRPTDPFDLIADYPVGGSIRVYTGRWYLWAGFCFFQFEAVRRTNLNFSTDWSAGLDTGGCNWSKLYRSLDQARVKDPGLTFEDVGSDIPLDVGRFELLGDWLHEANFHTPLTLAPDFRQQLRDRKRRLLIGRLTNAMLNDK